MLVQMSQPNSARTPRGAPGPPGMSLPDRLLLNIRETHEERILAESARGSRSYEMGLNAVKTKPVTKSGLPCSGVDPTSWLDEAKKSQWGNLNGRGVINIVVGGAVSNSNSSAATKAAALTGAGGSRGSLKKRGSSDDQNTSNKALDAEQPKPKLNFKDRLKRAVAKIEKSPEPVKATVATMGKKWNPKDKDHEITAGAHAAVPLLALLKEKSGGHQWHALSKMSTNPVMREGGIPFTIPHPARVAKERRDALAVRAAHMTPKEKA